MTRERFDQLDAKRLHELFVQVDEELAGRPEPVRVLVAGGAALAFRWSHRSTFDVDLIGMQLLSPWPSATCTFNPILTPKMTLKSSIRESLVVGSRSEEGSHRADDVEVFVYQGQGSPALEGGAGVGDAAAHHVADG